MTTTRNATWSTAMGSATLTAVVLLWAAAASGQEPAATSCITCHSDADFFDEEALAIVAGFAGDVHAEAGLSCHDCHGGNPALETAEHRVHVGVEEARHQQAVADIDLVGAGLDHRLDDVGDVDRVDPPVAHQDRRALAVALPVEDVAVAEVDVDHAANLAARSSRRGRAPTPGERSLT